MTRIIFIILFFLLSTNVFCEDKEYLFKEGPLINFAPPVVNKDYYLLEYGFVVPKEIKKWKYDYNAFVTAALFEDWKKRTDNLRAGALGFKGGVLMPLLKEKAFYKVATGFAKAVLHKNPVFGKEEQTARKKTMFLFEVGLVYKFDSLFAGLTYQRSNVSFFQRNLFLSVGVNY